MMTIRQENGNNDEDLVPGQSSNNGSIRIMKKIQQILTFFIPITDETGSRKSVAAGLSTIFVVGTGIGLLTPKNPALTPPYQSISAAIGYIYFLVSLFLGFSESNDITPCMNEYRIVLLDD
ncbi:MAG: hypothetical protein ACI90V_013404 [Bacillariaceae sp.]|jgi:hypothetical protein